MPAAVLTDQGEVVFLAAALAGPLFVRLFRNDVPVLTSSLLGDFDAALFPGYADLALAGVWSAPQLDGTGRAYSSVGTLTWTRGAGGVPETEYGWVMYVNPSPSSVLVAGARFTAPVTTDSPGQSILVSILAFLLRG